MSKVFLWCHILGEDPLKPFKIAIENLDDVDDLKAAIKEKWPNLLARTDAPRLLLFKVGIPIKELKEKVGGKQTGEDVEGAKLLGVSDEVKDVFEESPARSQVQIIVVRPTGTRTIIHFPDFLLTLRNSTLSYDAMARIFVVKLVVSDRYTSYSSLVDNHTCP